ncbi:MAG: aspartate ammonia-lyase [Oscillospiraceae bacterium]|jgi:aspartate ammonia-lyase|nr:aspartate ammonia-lyase [Oscillospiraceae bacterium]
MRTESDFLGSRQLPKGALYGLQTLRARENFALPFADAPEALVRAVLQIKLAAAESYRELAEKPVVYAAIAESCRELLAMEALPPDLHTNALQGGAGTSLHFAVNEVVANMAAVHLGGMPGDYALVHPLDDVNKGQSTNDAVPTALRIAAIQGVRALSEECAKLQEALQEKENAFDSIRKLGRTEWMDAVPTTLGQTFGAFAQAVARDRWRLYKMEERLRQVNLGGGAVGTLNQSPLHRKYRVLALEKLREITGIGLAAAEYPLDITQNADVFAEVSGLLKAAAVNRMKIAGDLRRMNSGPAGGLSELHLPPRQIGSTIMPGKVNPVICEMVQQTAMRVIANDTAITLAAGEGEFELNAFTPLIAHSLLESLDLLTAADRLFRVKCIAGITADAAHCAQILGASNAELLAQVPTVGYTAVEARSKAET